MFKDHNLNLDLLNFGGYFPFTNLSRISKCNIIVPVLYFPTQLFINSIAVKVDSNGNRYVVGQIPEYI